MRGPQHPISLWTRDTPVQPFQKVFCITGHIRSRLHPDSAALPVSPQQEHLSSWEKAVKVGGEAELCGSCRLGSTALVFLLPLTSATISFPTPCGNAAICLESSSRHSLTLLIHSRHLNAKWNATYLFLMCWGEPRHWKLPWTMMASLVQRASHSSMLGKKDRDTWTGNGRGCKAWTKHQN